MQSAVEKSTHQKSGETAEHQFTAMVACRRKGQPFCFGTGMRFTDNFACLGEVIVMTQNVTQKASSAVKGKSQTERNTQKVGQSLKEGVSSFLPGQFQK